MNRASRFQKVCFVAVISVAVWVIVAPFLADLLVTKLDIENPDAIVVLAGSAVYKERSALAAQLFLGRVAPRILLTDDGRSSGWSDSEKRNVKYVELAKRELVSAGVPEDRITIIEGDVAGTIDEARAVCASAEEMGLSKVLLVTSGYHSRRALRAFQATAAKESKPIEFGIAAVPPGGDTPAPSIWWLSTNGWKYVAGEYVKALYYETIL